MKERERKAVGLGLASEELTAIARLESLERNRDWFDAEITGGMYEQQEAVDAGPDASERGCRCFIWNDRPVDWQREGGEGANDAPSPTKSSPIAITSDNRFVWSVNPDNNSVSVFNVANGLNQKVAEIPVGRSRGAWPSLPTTRRSTSRTWRAAQSRSSTQQLAGGQDDRGRNRAVRLRSNPGRQQALCGQPILRTTCR